VVLSDHYGVIRQACFLGVLHTLLAKIALVSILDLNFLLEIVDFEHFSWAFPDKLNFLIHRQLLVDRLIVQIDNGLSSHDTGRHWAPLSVDLPNAFLSDHIHVDLLISAQHHQSYWVFLLSEVVLIYNWDYRLIDINRFDML
jgi:hypothetical protein